MPQTFECFSKLPAELRLKIWDMSIVGRVITVKPARHGLYSLDGGPPTPLLYVCQESRTQALFHYTPFLRYDTSNNLGAYISYTHDTILLQRDNSWMTVELAIACLKPDLDKVESLVVDMEFIQPQRLRTRNLSTPEQLISLFRSELTGLREVFFLARGLSCYYYTAHSEPVIALKDIRPFREGPPDDYWPRCCFWHCDGEVDASFDTSRWIVYPNSVWKLDMNEWVRLNQKKGVGRGPYGFDSLRRRTLIERLCRNE